MTDYLTEKYKHVHRLQGLANGLEEDIRQALEKALEAVTGKIVLLETKAGETKSIVHRKKYLSQLRIEIERVLAKVYRKMGEDIESKATGVVQATPEIVDSWIKKKITPKITVTFGVPKLSEKSIRSWFHASRIEGLYFNEWLKKLKSNMADRIMRETQQAMILSETGRDTVRRIQNALSIARKSAGGLAYNAIYQAHNWAEHEYHLENDDIIRAVRFTVELDRRTSPLCRSLDGKIFKLDEAPLPPLHWLCRSLLSPVFKYEALNRAIGNRIARIDTHSRTVKHRDGTTSTKYQKLRIQDPKGDITYNQWMLSLVKSNDSRNVAFAKEVLGPTRFKLISSGKLKMESLYYHGKLRKISDLKRLIK